VQTAIIAAEVVIVDVTGVPKTPSWTCLLCD
jgi:hypothetical protein